MPRQPSHEMAGGNRALVADAGLGLEHEAAIVQELNDAQGRPVDIGGYYHPNPKKAEAAMRPSQTFNTSLESFLSR